MFETIFIEDHLKGNQKAQDIISRFKGSEVKFIDRYDNFWGRVKKPYLHKRTNLNLYLAHKKGQLVKEAPDAYGLSGEKHFYFIHAYNCIYECEYCYLQGYFNSPDVVLFLNHDEIKEQMKEKLNENPGQKVWFHAGEFSDSLALSHITGELEEYWEFFKHNPNALLELRTKSVNAKKLEKLTPLPNAFVSFSLSPEKTAKNIDLKTPPTKLRLKTIKALRDKGFEIGIHFDPIVYSEDVFELYDELIDQLKQTGDLSKLGYISIGVARFTPDVYRETKRNYPKSSMFGAEFIKSENDIMRYSRPMRNWILNNIKERLIRAGAPADKVYLCMEN